MQKSSTFYFSAFEENCQATRKTKKCEFTKYFRKRVLHSAVFCATIFLVEQRLFNNLIECRPLWRSRLAWSRARDWKSRRRQKRLEGSNPSFSAHNGVLNQDSILFYVNGRLAIFVEKRLLFSSVCRIINIID